MLKNQKRTNQARTLIILIFCSCFLLMANSAFAGSAKDIQNRMKSRHPQIITLKNSGVVGENNLGYLEFRATPKKKNIVDAENSDRKQIYAAIAKKSNASAKLVGTRRAATIAKKGKAGHLYQDTNGKWYKK